MKLIMKKKVRACETCTLTIMGGYAKVSVYILVRDLCQRKGWGGVHQSMLGVEKALNEVIHRLQASFHAT